MNNLLSTKVRVTNRMSPSTKAISIQLRILPGEMVTVGERATEWPAFIFVTSSAGRRGWVPERLLDKTRPNAKVLQEYDTTTLDPLVGELMTVIQTDLEGGWLWCEDSRGRLGWFPINHIEYLHPESSKD